MTHWQDDLDRAVNETVRDIIAEIGRRGDDALLEYTARFDRLSVADAAALEVPPARIDRALESIDPAHRRALESAAQRVRDYHQHQLAGELAVP